MGIDPPSIVGNQRRDCGEAKPSRCHGPTRACSPTPLCGHKIGAILEHRFGSNAFMIYHGGAADAQTVSPLRFNLVLVWMWSPSTGSTAYPYDTGRTLWEQENH